MRYWLHMEKGKSVYDNFFDYDEGGRKEITDIVFSYTACGWRVTRLEIMGGSGILW